MSAVLIAQVGGFIVGLPGNDPADETDSQTAAAGTLNVNVPAVAGTRAFLTVEPFIQPDSGMATPTNGALTQTAAGSLGATTYYVRSTVVNENGAESPLSPETTLSASASNVLNVASPAAETGAVAWRCYVSNTAGGGTGTETFQSEQAIGTAFVEPTTGLVAGTAMPLQLASLANGACTILVSQGAGTLTVTTTQ